MGHGYLILPASIYLAWTRRSALVADLTEAGLLAAADLGPRCGRVAGGCRDEHYDRRAVLPDRHVRRFHLGRTRNRRRPRPGPTARASSVRAAKRRLHRSDPTAADGVVRRRRAAPHRRSGPALQGELITIPGSSWEVAKACSGINYLMSALMMAYLYAALTYRSWRYRIGFFLAAAALALLANAIRV